MQPIIRGIQSVGAVDIYYAYNGNNGLLSLPSTIELMAGSDKIKSIDTSNGLALAGFRLDGEFLRASPQIASSAMIPILGGGGVALTNNNRTGTLTLNCTKVSTPSIGDKSSSSTDEAVQADTQTAVGAMYMGRGIGPMAGDTGADTKVYDFVFIAQAQQGQAGGDSAGATICITFKFNGLCTQVQFDGCTIASIDPIALTGNDAASYNVVVNYLNWRVKYNANPSDHFIEKPIGASTDSGS